MRNGTRPVIHRFRRKSIPGADKAWSIAIARFGANATKGELIMNATSQWKRVSGKSALVVGLATLASAMGSSALACSLSNPAMPLPRAVPPIQQGAKMMPAVYRPGSETFIPVGLETSAANSGIVGLWKITMISDGVPPNPVPEGATVDFGTVQWHADGTEIMISGGRPPSTGDVCMGVWEKTGPHTYKLKHLALAWVSSDTPPSMGGPGPSPAQFLGPARIQEVVTLDKSRASYQGTFTLDQYNADESMRLVHVSGTITGTRVTVN